MMQMAYGLPLPVAPSKASRLALHGRMRHSVASDQQPAYRPGSAPQGCAAPGCARP